MIQNLKPTWLASQYAPNHLEVTYWIDTTADPMGTIIKTWNGSEWVIISNEGEVIDDVAGLRQELNRLESVKVDYDTLEVVVENLHNNIDACANEIDSLKRGDTLPIATATKKGAVRIGKDINIDANGVISAKRQVEFVKQTEYNALANKDSEVLYVVTDEADAADAVLYNASEDRFFL